MAQQLVSSTGWKPEKNNKKTSQGDRNVKTSSMNKNKRKNKKPYRGQGKV